MKRSPSKSDGSHHVDDVLGALKCAGVSVTPMGAETYELANDFALLVMLLPKQVGYELVMQLMEHFGSNEDSFVPHLIKLSKDRNSTSRRAALRVVK